MILDENENNSIQKLELDKYRRNTKILGISIFSNGFILTLSLIYFLYNDSHLIFEINGSELIYTLLTFLAIFFICLSIMISGYKLIKSNGNNQSVTSGLKWMIPIWCLILLGGFISFIFSS